MLQTESQQSERFYSRVARKYDAMFERAILAEGRLTELAREYLDGRELLDLACGNGRWLERLRPRRYVGLDLNETMLGYGRRRYPAAGFLRGDMSRLPLRDGSFDGAMTMFGAMGHLKPEGQRVMVAEIGRVLRPGGVAIFTNGNQWSPFNLPTTIRAGRVKIEGVRMRVHSSTPRTLKALLEGFEVLHLESYDYSFLPIMPLKFGACLMGRGYQGTYAGVMNDFDGCRHIPGLRWFGKQLVAVGRWTASAASTKTGNLGNLAS